MFYVNELTFNQICIYIQEKITQTENHHEDSSLKIDAKSSFIVYFYFTNFDLNEENLHYNHSKK